MFCLKTVNIHARGEIGGIECDLVAATAMMLGIDERSNLPPEHVIHSSVTMPLSGNSKRISVDGLNGFG